MADGGGGGGAPARVRLALLRHVHNTQALRGLRLRDFARYRHYCSRRLARLHRALKFQHTAGPRAPRYVPRDLTPDLVVSEEWLTIPLTLAERAWAHAMAIKHPLGAADAATEPAERRRILSRLAKAIGHAKQLVALCAERADEHTCLEANAYLAFLEGTRALERGDDFQTALAKFTASRTLCEQLQLIATGESAAEQQAVCRTRVDDLDAPIRFCRYQLQRRGALNAETGSEVDLASLETLTGPGADMLRAQLAAAASEARRSGAAGGFQWTYRGKAFKAQGVKAADALRAAEASQASLATAGDADARMRHFDALLGAFADARAAAKADAALILGGDKESTALRESHEALERACHCAYLEHSLARNAALARDVADQLTPRMRNGLVSGSGEGTAQPRDLVALYGTAAATAGELVAAADGASDRSLATWAVATEELLHARRAFWLAHCWAERGALAQAHALAARCEARCEEVEARGAGLSDAMDAPDSGEPPLAAAAELRSRATSLRAIVRARAAAEAAAAAGGGDVAGPPPTLAADPCAFVSHVAPRLGKRGGGGGGVASSTIAALPPPFALAPAAPLVLDTAFDAVSAWPATAPSASGSESAPSPAKSGGWGQRLFGWGT